MFFLLSKILSFFIYPFTWIVFLVIFGFFTKREKRKKWSFRIAAIVAIFFTNTVIFSEFTRLWEPRGTKIENVAHHDVAIVLGGMAEYDNSMERLSLRRGGDRIWQAIHLYQLGIVDQLMIVGANGDLVDKNLNEAVQFKEVLLDFGIPDEDIIVETNSKNTYQNAIESKKILDKHEEIDSYLLVTSAMHMRRSMACFKAAGFDEIDGFTTDHFTGEVRGYNVGQFLLPNISVMDDWGGLLHEWLGYMTYTAAGYL